MSQETMLFKVIVIVPRLTPSSFTLFRSPNEPNKCFICLAVVVPMVLLIVNNPIVTCHCCHNALMKEITRAKVSLPLFDIHKSKVVV